MKNLKKPEKGRPGPLGVSLEEVRKACVQLEREGRFVGPMNVRLQIGRGSFTTIQRHLRDLGYGSSEPRRRRQV